jgi:hypothetical protein
VSNSLLSDAHVAHEALFRFSGKIGDILCTPIRNGRPDCHPDLLSPWVSTDWADIEPFSTAEMTRTVNDFGKRYLDPALRNLSQMVCSAVQSGAGMGYGALACGEMAGIDIYYQQELGMTDLQRVDSWRCATDPGRGLSLVYVAEHDMIRDVINRRIGIAYHLRRLP